MITFLGYMDTPEELLEGRRRCLFGCDSEADAASLPVSDGLTLPNGSVTAKPAPFSYAVVPGGGVRVLDSEGSWGAL